MLTEKECRNALSDLKNQLEDILGEESENVESVNVLNQLMDEHFENPPLSLNEVRQFWHEGIPVWDTELEEYVQIHDVIGNEENGLVSVEQFFFESISVYQYHSKRFYRKEVVQE